MLKDTKIIVGTYDADGTLHVLYAKRTPLTSKISARLDSIRAKRLVLREKARPISVKIKALRLKVRASVKKVTRQKYRDMIKELLAKKAPLIDKLRKLRMAEAKLLGIRMRRRKKRIGLRKKHVKRMRKLTGTTLDIIANREDDAQKKSRTAARVPHLQKKPVGFVSFKDIKAVNSKYTGADEAGKLEAGWASLCPKGWYTKMLNVDSNPEQWALSDGSYETSSIQKKAKGWILFSDGTYIPGKDINTMADYV